MKNQREDQHNAVKGTTRTPAKVNRGGLGIPPKGKLPPRPTPKPGRGNHQAESTG